jgi:hypothetical protein
MGRVGSDEGDEGTMASRKAFLNSCARALAACLGAGGALALAAPTAAQDGNLRNLVSDLYGGDGITLDAGFHEAHFAAAGEAELNDLSNILASNIGAFSFNSSVSAISFDVAQGVPVRSQQSLGPLLAERATTIGRGRVNVAASISSIDFQQLDGVDISELTLDLHHSLINENNGQPFNAPWDHDEIHLALDLSIEQQVLALYGTFGVTNALDVGVIIPVVSMEASVNANATLHTTFCDPAFFNPGNAFLCVPVAEGAGIPVHSLPSDFSPTDSNSGDAFGVGDIILRTKLNLSEGRDGPIDFGVLGQVSLPTGDESDLLGTGSTAVQGMFIASSSLGAVNPHVNVGYEHFTDDELDRSNWRYVVGVDVAARDNLGFSLETIGRIEADDDTFLDLAIGGKWAVNGQVPLSASILLPLNRDEGLRPDFVLTFGIETTF